MKEKLSRKVGMVEKMKTLVGKTASHVIPLLEPAGHARRDL